MILGGLRSAKCRHRSRTRQPIEGVGVASSLRKLGFDTFLCQNWLRGGLDPLTTRGAAVTDFPETRESLIVRVKDPDDRDAWEQFVGMYRPVVYRVARRRGLQEADAQDLAQHVLMSVAGAIDQWEKREGIQFETG